MKTVQGSNSPLANAGIMFLRSISSPGEALTIEIPPEGRKPGGPHIVFDEAVKPKSSILASSVFMRVLLIVTGITVLAGVAQMVLAERWSQPTPNEQTVFDAMATAWKMGFGALIGLLSGKNL